MCISDGGNLWTICIKSRNLSRVGKSLDFVASCRNLHYTNWSKSNNCQIFRYSSPHACPIHTNGFRWKTWFSDGIGKILFVTPSHGSKITGSQINIGQKGCPMDSIDIQSSDGIKWSPSMSIEKTRSVVVNLNSDNELTFRPLLIFSLSPTELGKYYSTRKYYCARKIQLKLNVLFERFYSTSNNKVHTNLALFKLWIWGSQEIRYANFLWCWHGQRSLGRAHILFLYPYLRLKMLISVYIIEQFSAVT